MDIKVYSSSLTANTTEITCKVTDQISPALINVAETSPVRHAAANTRRDQLFFSCGCVLQDNSVFSGPYSRSKAIAGLLTFRFTIREVVERWL